MFTIEASFRQAIRVTASPQEVFAVVADVPDSAAHFPGVESLDADSAGYRWILKRAGVGKLSLQLVYGCRYTSDSALPVVRWEPIEGIGSARVSGHWQIDPDGTGTRLTLHNQLALRIDAPRLIRRPAAAVLEKENARMLRTYLANLTTTFDGGDGRTHR
ncbi:MAG: hypothetical protein CMJ87_13240 [Planctomycetes bacterium]|jgi:carbon monoxide dehydrogenase subunit G|nr:hypothetical protein [Planctomycetota bacterium]